MDNKNENEGQANRGFFKLEPNQTYSESSSSALLTLFFYSALMFTLPLLVLFTTGGYIEQYFQLKPPYTQLAPAILAVVVVNIIIVAYVIKAFRENAKETPVEKTLEERKKKEWMILEKYNFFLHLTENNLGNKGNIRMTLLWQKIY